MMTFLLITLGIAVVIVLIWRLVRGKPSSPPAAITRLAVAWVTVMAVCGGLIVAWGIYALGHLDGFNR